MYAASSDTPDAEIAALRALLAERDAVLAERNVELRNATFEIEKLKVQLATLRRDRYGKSSEKLAAEIGQLEMLIGDAEEDQAQAAAGAEARTKGQPGNQRRPALRKPLPEHLPRETVLHEPVFACRCGCTDPKRLTRLGEDVTEVLEKIPARLKVIRHVRPRYACRDCEAVLQAPAPDLPVEKGRPRHLRGPADAYDQAVSLWAVATLAAGQGEPHGCAQAPDSHVDLGAQATAGTAKGLIFRPPFLAPAACWWARMMVLSTIRYSKSGSSDIASKMRRQTPLSLQRLKRRNTLFQSPNTSGGSRHGEPVRTIHNTPSTNMWLSRPVEPFWSDGPMISGAIRSHAASLSTKRSKTPKAAS